MMSQQQAGGLLEQGGERDGPSEDDLFTRTVLVGARKIYYGENPEQILQMIQAGATPGQGIAMATITILEMAMASLAEQGKDTPPELMFDPEGPAEYIIEDLAEIVAAQGGGDVESLEEEAEQAYIQNVGQAMGEQQQSGSGEMAPPQSGGGLLDQAAAPPPMNVPDPTAGRM